MEHSNKPEILFITSYPPRECGIATYSHDLSRELDEMALARHATKVIPNPYLHLRRPQWLAAKPAY